MKATGSAKRNAGFTMVEVVIASFMTTIVVASALGLFISYEMFWREASVHIDANRIASMAMNRIAYGVGTNCGLRAASAVVLTSGTNGWVLDFSDSNTNPVGTFEYESDVQTLFYTPAGMGAADMVVAEPMAHATANTQDNLLLLDFTVDLQRGRFSATRQLDTTLRWRN